MFGLSLKFTKKLLEAGALPHTPLGELTSYDASQDPLYIVGSSLSAPLPRGVQRHPRQRNMRQRNPRGDKTRKLGTKFTFGQLILRKIIKIVATRCHILRLKCTKFDFGWGSAPDPAGGAHSAPPDPHSGFKGSYF